VLGAGLPAGDLDGRLRRLEELGRRGVASLTLTHLFPNDVAGHTEGIPESQRKFPICPLRTGVDESRGLTPAGAEIVRRMVDLRMVPDLTHCTPKARAEVLRDVDGRVPVIVSHAGLQSLNPVPYNLADEEVLEIAATGGVIGVIFMPYWLHKDHPRAGLGAIWDTMHRIYRLTGNWGSVAIGTDFDGFTDPPDDVENASKLPAVRRMLEQKGLAAADVEDVLGRNARRVLNDCWR
jgi:membrane dipeptidase